MPTQHSKDNPSGQWLAGQDSTPSRPARRAAQPGNLSICGHCGSVGKPAKVAPGSILIELVLWLFLLVPGLIYSLWRVGSKRPTCRNCGASYSMVPVHSPRGRQLAAEFRADTTARD